VADQSDLYVDYEIVRGQDFCMRFTLAPMDWTGATGELVIDTLEPDGLAATLSVTGGAVKTSQFFKEIPGATTEDYPAGSYPYGVWITYPGGARLRRGHGRIVVR
jgi:hypothetical protein